MATSAFEDRLSSKAYKTWLKAGLCLGFLKEGLCPFIERESQTLYSNVLSKVRPSVLCGGLCGPLPQCTTCKAQNIVWNNRNRKWELNRCPVFLCHNFVTTIQQEHVSPQPRGMCWKNSNVQAWPSSPWEVAKTLMDTIEDGTKKTSPAECDCSSLLKFIEYSKVCQGKISTGDATKVRQHRNEIMHSSNMELSDADLRKFANDMITLLKSIGDYVTNIPAQTAVQHIEETRDTDIEITVGDEIRVFKETQQGIQDTVTKQFDDMREMKKAVSDLETKAERKTDEHGKELKLLKRKMSGIPQEQRKGMKKLKNETEKKLRKQEDEVDRLTEIVKDTGERLGKQEDEVGRLAETMEGTGERLGKQKDEVGRLTKIVEDTGERLGKQEDEMGRLTETTDAEIKVLKQSQETMKRELEEKLNYIKSIQETLRKLTSPKTTSERTAIDLQDFLLNHYREKFSSIPVSPMFSKKTVPLESLFTELVVVEDIDKGLGQMPQRGQKEEREVPVSSYEDIFHKDDKRMKDIYLIAEGGAGKTVSCKQMVNTWVRTHEQQQVVGCLNHNETVMKRFKYLFFVPLREVSGKNDLIDAVCECLTDQASIKTMIRNVFDTSPNEVLVVLDGLDEVKVIPGRHQSHSYTILSTTRPWKFDIVQQSDHLEVDRLLKLKGLDDKRIPELIDKVLENCYDDTTKVARKNIKTNIKSHGLMTPARVPLVLVSLIHMCHEQKSLSPSLTRTMQDIIDCIIECNEKKVPAGDLYPAPEQVAQPLKGINDEECSLLRYRGIIMALSKLAFYALIIEDKENSLVLSEKTLRKYFSSDNDLNLCLTLGLLSKTEQLGYLKKKVVISFPHKVFQEWFAALCVVNDTEAFTKLKQYLMSTETTLDMSNVFAFVCGMCGESGSGLTKRVMEICTSSPDIQHYHTTANYSSIVERLTDMYIRCAIECETIGQVDTTVLYISDIRVSLSYDTVNNDMYHRAVSYLIDTNASRLTAVELHNWIYQQSVPQVIREALCNHTFDSLRRLNVQDVDVAVVNSMLTNSPGIQVLAVRYLDQSSVGLCLPLLQQLQHLKLVQFPVTRDFLQQLSALLHLGQLRSLYLRKADIGDHYLDLSSLTHLTTLTLEYITMTSSVWQGMLQTMNTVQSLQVLELGNITLRGDTRSGTTTQMSTWFMSQLQELKCRCTLGSPQVCLPLLAGLHDASSLRSLVIEGYRVPTEQVTMIARAIPHLYQLEKLELWGTDFRDQQLSLKYNTKLQKLILRRVQMYPTSWHHLFDSLQSLQHLNNIKLYGVNISLDDVRLPKHLVITSHENSVHEAGAIDVECKQI